MLYLEVMGVSVLISHITTLLQPAAAVKQTLSTLHNISISDVVLYQRTNHGFPKEMPRLK